MKGIWKLSGQFYGWLAENGWFYAASGNRFGTINNNVLYNYEGKYSGEIINEEYIGFNADHKDWQGSSCNLDSEITIEPQMDRSGFERIGYTDPK